MLYITTVSIQTNQGDYLAIRVWPLVYELKLASSKIKKT
jgi:hypothetical protein